MPGRVPGRPAARRLAGRGAAAGGAPSEERGADAGVPPHSGRATPERGASGPGSRLGACGRPAAGSIGRRGLSAWQLSCPGLRRPRSAAAPGSGWAGGGRCRGWICRAPALASAPRGPPRGTVSGKVLPEPRTSELRTPRPVGPCLAAERPSASVVPQAGPWCSQPCGSPRSDGGIPPSCWPQGPRSAAPAPLPPCPAASLGVLQLHPPRFPGARRLVPAAAGLWHRLGRRPLQRVAELLLASLLERSAQFLHKLKKSSFQFYLPFPRALRRGESSLRARRPESPSCVLSLETRAGPAGRFIQTLSQVNARISGSVPSVRDS